MRKRYMRWFGRILLMLSGVIISLLILETFLRFYFPSDKYFIWPPLLQAEFHPLPDLLPGVDGPARFMVNSEGMRGDEMPSDDVFKILCLGGSTTECLYLDQHESWPYLIQKKLNPDRTSQAYWVGNCGRSGQNTRDHILHMKFLLQQYQDIDCVVLLCGVNDFIYRLGKGEKYNPYYMSDPESMRVQLKHAFSIYPFKWDRPFYKRTALWRMTDKMHDLLEKKEFFQDREGEFYIHNRSKRYRAEQAGRIFHELPDLGSALKEYETNLQTIIAMAVNQDVRILFLTQPSIWNPDMDEKSRDLLWIGGIKARGKKSDKWYYAVECLSEGMEMYNDVMRKVCLKQKADCVDLAVLLPRDSSMFYDDVHITERGAETVSEAVAAFLANRSGRDGYF